MKLIEILLEYIDKAKTLKSYGEKLEQRAEGDHSAEDLNQEQILEKFIESDPTGKTGTYTLWMIKTYLNYGIRYLEDLERANYALKLFHKFKHKIPIEKRDINKIKSLSDLEDIVEQFREQKTGKEIKKEIKREVLQETDIIYEGPDGMIVVPRTEKASCFWGQGTKWCTAATETKNFFSYYGGKDNLYIFIFSNGRKVQLSFKHAQLMDEKDNNIPNFFKNSNYPSSEKFFFKAFVHNLESKDYSLDQTLKIFSKIIDLTRFDKDLITMLLNIIKSYYKINSEKSFYEYLYNFIVVNNNKSLMLDLKFLFDEKSIKRLESNVSYSTINQKNVDDELVYDLIKLNSEYFSIDFSLIKESKLVKLLEYINNNIRKNNEKSILYVKLLNILIKNITSLSAKLLESLYKLIESNIDYFINSNRINDENRKLDFSILANISEQKISSFFSNAKNPNIVKLVTKLSEKIKPLINVVIKSNINSYEKMSLLVELLLNNIKNEKVSEDFLVTNIIEKLPKKDLIVLSEIITDTINDHYSLSEYIDSIESITKLLNLINNYLDNEISQKSKKLDIIDPSFFQENKGEKLYYYYKYVLNNDLNKISKTLKSNKFNDFYDQDKKEAILFFEYVLNDYYANFFSTGKKIPEKEKFYSILKYVIDKILTSNKSAINSNYFKNIKLILNKMVNKADETDLDFIVYINDKIS